MDPGLNQNGKSISSMCLKCDSIKVIVDQTLKINLILVWVEEKTFATIIFE